MSSFYAWRSQKRKKTDGLSVFSALLGSLCVKAARKILFKSTLNRINIIRPFPHPPRWNDHLSLTICPCQIKRWPLRMRVSTFVSSNFFVLFQTPKDVILITIFPVSLFSRRPAVNFINVKRTNFSYECHVLAAFSS